MVSFAIVLLIVSGTDVVLLQSLAAMAKKTESLLDDRIFLGQVSLALYLFPVAFAGLAVNLLSHVLVNHLDKAETEFDKAAAASGKRDAESARHWRPMINANGNFPESIVLVASSAGAALIFILDVWTGADIRLHVLYISPLAVVARYCAKPGVSILALAITTILQVITFSVEAIAIPSFITDIGVAFIASVMVVFLARSSRSSYLVALNHATTDALTSLANRRAFIAEVESEIARQKRYPGVFSLAVVDLDGFKAHNDLKGHAAGDEALKIAADILRGCIRESDSAGRLGGDEFAILIPNTQDDDCSLMINNLCATIAARMAAAGFAVTASVGCKTFRAPPDNASFAIQQADEIMYQAKGSGKNRAVHSQAS
ncbi:MAG: GGDEF domain-containing protein [Gallionella sp.]